MHRMDVVVDCNALLQFSDTDLLIRQHRFMKSDGGTLWIHGGISGNAIQGQPQHTGSTLVQVCLSLHLGHVS